ncbi:MAG: DUF21 domain-containing protein [Nanoarchaeota archaeon]|nr:DUF21 domain-containing protein [Nanoarchaeota archaeon]MBU1643858.1 DUF21 domain-containing protein [Nanoarchaeota archaeon]MBU1977450.1 DUF21 domain-containing protein [Nanoarchaeota archaeon]
MNPFYFIVIIFLLSLSAMFSGLTLGILSLDQDMLRRKMQLGQKDAKLIFPLRKKGNLLLSTLILGNVAVNTTLAIFLGSIAKGVIAGIIATGLIVVFGEIVPQAVFARHGLRFGARLVWLVKIAMFIFYPIAKPISWFLDRWLGGGLPTKFSRRELRLFIREQRKHAEEIKHREFELLERGLLFSATKVKEVMTPKKNVFFLTEDLLLTKETLKKIHYRGHSRIPVLNTKKNKVVGILYSKDLINIDPEYNIPLREIMRKKINFIGRNDKLGGLLKKFQDKKVHLFIVLDKSKRISGIITLEDVLEEIVGEIVDEYDKVIDMREAHKHKDIMKKLPQPKVQNITADAQPKTN